MSTMKYDVAILGGGAIGLCSAYYLSARGISVAVIDKGEMGHGSSLHNAGYISPSHFVPLAAPGLILQALKWMANPASPLYIKPRLDPHFMAWAWKFARACDEQTARKAMPVLRDLLLESARLTDELSRVEGMNFHLTRRGLGILFNTEQGRRACDHERHLADEVGVEARHLDPRGLQALDPGMEFRAQGGIYFPGDMHLVPATLVENLSAYLHAHGVHLLMNCEVRSFDLWNNAIRSVETSTGTVEARDYVLAGGAWSASLARKVGLTMHLEAGKGYSITVSNPAVKPALPYIFQERRVAVTPFADALRFAGTMEFTGIDLRENPRRVNAILDSIPHYFGNVPRPTIPEGEVWCGLRPVTPDGLPFIGRYRRIENLIAATGHAMLGISLAAVTGAIVRDLVERTSVGLDLTLLHPERYD